MLSDFSHIDYQMYNNSTAKWPLKTKSGMKRVDRVLYRLPAPAGMAATPGAETRTSLAFQGPADGPQAGDDICLLGSHPQGAKFRARSARAAVARIPIPAIGPVGGSTKISV